MSRRTGRFGLYAVALSLAGAACGSSRAVGTGSTTSSPTTTVTSASTTTRVSLEVTVPDCGVGAYRPTTLLIVCGTSGTMATGIQWSSWDSSGASGTGTVDLQPGKSQLSGQANLQLTNAVDKGAGGPQFTHLTITWIGRSPDGRPSDSYELGNGS